MGAVMGISSSCNTIIFVRVPKEEPDRSRIEEGWREVCVVNGWYTLVSEYHAFTSYLFIDARRY